MSSKATREVQVNVRQIQVAPAAELSEADDGSVFIALEEPPPVRTVLAITDADGKPSALEVTRVVEVPEADGRGVRGLYGRFVEEGALQRLARVGTEHIEAGEPPDPSQPSLQDDESDHVDAGSSMAMPAPVVDPDDSEPISVDDAPSPETEEAAGRRGRKRRGRKRK